MGLNDEILDFEGRNPIRSIFFWSYGPWFFFWFFGEVPEQPDQVARKLNFWLRTSNNDPKQNGKS